MEMRRLWLIFFIAIFGCASSGFNVKEYRQKILSVKFENKDMFFVGDSIKVGNSVVTVVNIYPRSSERYGSVELTIRDRSGFRKVFLDKFDYYIVDSNHAVVVLDVDTSSPADRNVTLGICPPSRLPVKLSKMELAAASLSPKEFLIKLNGKMTRLSIDKPFKRKGLLVRLTAVSTSSNALDRKGSLYFDLFLKEGDEIVMSGSRLRVKKIEWEKMPSSRSVTLVKGLEYLILREGDSRKIDDGVDLRVARIDRKYVELIIKVRDVSLGENFVVP